MPFPLYLVDAFVDQPFSGNPAGVCLLPEEQPAKWMQQVAMEMNQAETAFVCPKVDGSYSLRWFTPQVEVDLCGHATLAAAHTLWREAGRITVCHPLSHAQWFAKRNPQGR
ncbi:PhzF family phenazine biosynthesis protein [Cellvibrio sp. KY-GH-1]|uniref:PhzF family phenazine biosynthesis protein n=1 Tax=Cellvibrio sp. KY-GH-1 TaxID=2303332 RepID=UPI001CD996CB|nr:PhzF family phenazine biosynthesis isomerase [Cellvibrio sp. KY-GH-1]